MRVDWLKAFVVGLDISVDIGFYVAFDSIDCPRLVGASLGGRRHICLLYLHSHMPKL